MDKVKAFMVGHFERILVLAILVATVLVTLSVTQKALLLNFYYLPVLTAGYFLGRRMGALTAVFCVLTVVFLLAATNGDFSVGHKPVHVYSFIAGWSGFLILASVAVGTLYERNERRVQDLRRAYVGVLEILAKYLEDTDRYTKGHSMRVADLAVNIATAMDLSPEQVENIRVSALLHDIGKVEVSSDLIRKAASLSQEERTLVDTHSTRGAEILQQVGNVLKGAIPIILAHHRHFSGTDESAVPLGARIVAVADAFDAMTSDRPYRKGMPPWKACEELRAAAGKQFDPDVVAAFTTVLAAAPEPV